jgi:hypothetical protein
MKTWHNYSWSDYSEGKCFLVVLCILTLNLLTTTIVAPPSNASKWQVGFNSAFKGLKLQDQDRAKWMGQ